MPLWVAIVCALTTAATWAIVPRLLEGTDEADKPLAMLRGEGFEMRMPGRPERTADEIPIPVVGSAAHLVPPTKATTYTSDGDRTAYAVSVIEGPVTAAVDLRDGLAGMASALGGSVRDSTRTRHRGLAAIDATIAGVADGEATAFVRVVHAGTRLLVVQGIVDGSSAETPPPAYAAIVASLHVRRAARPADAAAGEPIVARKVATPPPAGMAAGLAACRRQAAGKPVSDGVRRTVRRLCTKAAGENLAAVEGATLAACLAVARETGDIERCGFDVVLPR